MEYNRLAFVIRSGPYSMGTMAINNRVGDNIPDE